MALRLHRFRRHLHWWTAALLTTGFAIAWIMAALPLTALLLKFLLYQIHKTIGLCVAGLAIARLMLAFQASDRPHGLTAALYGLLLIVPLLGYVTAASSPVAIPTLFLLMFRIPHLIGPDQAVFEIIRPLHLWLAVGLVGLAGWHGARMFSGASGSALFRVARSRDAHPPSKPG